MGLGMQLGEKPLAQHHEAHEDQRFDTQHQKQEKILWSNSAPWFSGEAQRPLDDDLKAHLLS